MTQRFLHSFALDCCGREVMSWVVTTKGIDSGLVSDFMMKALEYRFGPCSKPPRKIQWLTDYGSCYTSIKTRRFARQIGLRPVTTPVESPQSNGMT